MPHLRPGQPAPDVTLSLLGGPTVSLSSYWGNGRATLLIFLRHLA
jgi:peroxiredoxin